jgi:hypothetical protein
MSRGFAILWLVLAVVVILLLLMYEVVSWQQCLGGDPWWYCLRILAR